MTLSSFHINIHSPSTRGLSPLLHSTTQIKSRLIFSSKVLNLLALKYFFFERAGEREVFLKSGSSPSIPAAP